MSQNFNSDFKSVFELHSSSVKVSQSYSFKLLIFSIEIACI